MFIRQIHYLLALSKTEHFGRAAEACHVSQPALSTAIQHLEEELGVTIVRRGQRFQGFTLEGERLLQWARILAQDWECMRQEAAQCNRQLTGTLRIGSDHTDLQAAMDRNITVAEVTYCNSNSVAEHVVMMTLALVRNYIPSYNWVIKGGWNIADCVARSYDLEAMNVGTVAAGRIGLRVLRLLKPFDVKLHYLDRHRLPEAVEQELNLTYHSSLESLTKVCDVVTLNCPLHPETEHMINEQTLKNFKRGAYLINTARGKLCDRDAIVDALESGQLAGYAGDVWFPQPAPNDHPWRTMPNHGMTPHISGTSLSAQTRYAAGTREILECYFDGRPIRDEYLIVQGGQLAGVGAHSYSKGNATGGSEEAAQFKKD